MCVGDIWKNAAQGTVFDLMVSAGFWCENPKVGLILLNDYDYLDTFY